MMRPIGVNQVSPDMLRDQGAQATFQAGVIKGLSQQETEAEEAKQLYQQFVGETFFGQMMK